MNQIETKIINLFSKDLTTSLTIHQISKLIKKSYGNVHKVANEMITNKILNKITVGHSTLCTLNLRSDLSLNLLINNAIIRKSSIKSLDSVGETIDLLRSKANIISVFQDGKSTVFVGLDQKELAAEILKIKPDFKYQILDVKSFKESIDKKQLDKTIFYGFEEFYRIARDAR